MNGNPGRDPNAAENYLTGNCLIDRAACDRGRWRIEYGAIRTEQSRTRTLCPKGAHGVLERGDQDGPVATHIWLRGNDLLQPSGVSVP
jgi:hypothetical protein